MAQQDHPEWLIELLKGLPDQQEPNYETAVHRLREAAQRRVTEIGRNIERSLEETELPDSIQWDRIELNVGALKAIADDETLSTELRFDAYFVWQTQL